MEKSAVNVDSGGLRIHDIILSIDKVWCRSIPSTPDFCQLSSTEIVNTVQLTCLIVKYVNIFFLFIVRIVLTLSKMSMKSNG